MKPQPASTQLQRSWSNESPHGQVQPPAAAAHSIVSELRKYDEQLHHKPRWLVLNKVDLLPAEERQAAVDAFIQRYAALTPEDPDQTTVRDEPIVPRSFVISALTGEGCRELTFAIAEFLAQAAPQEDPEAVREPEPAGLSTE